MASWKLMRRTFLTAIKGLNERMEEKRGLSEEKLCIFMGTNRIGSEVAQCVNRAKSSSQEVIEVFETSITEKSMH